MLFAVQREVWLRIDLLLVNFYFHFPLNYRIMMFLTSLPEVIGRGLLSDPIGLSWAVSGAVLWAQLFLGAVLCWKLKKAPGLLPLLRCITDGQPSLLLGAEKKRKQEPSYFNISCCNMAIRTLLPGSQEMAGTGLDETGTSLMG